jgi:hypothetical protein
MWYTVATLKNHQEFEYLEEFNIRWSPWTDSDFETIAGVHQPIPD